MTIRVARLFESILVMVIVLHLHWDLSEFKRTMTICAASLFGGDLGHGHRLFHSLRIYPTTLPRPWSEDHGLNPPLSTENPRNKGSSGSGAPIFGFGLADPAPKGWG